MKNEFIAVLIILSCIVLFTIIAYPTLFTSSSSVKNSSTIEGIYTGKAKGRKTGYALKINKDSSIHLACVSKNRDTSEYYGLIKAVNDTIFHISCQKEVNYGNMLSFDEDSIVIIIDSAYVTFFDDFIVTYTNGTSKKLQNDKKTTGFTKHLTLHTNRRLYNELMGRNYLTVSTTFNSPFTGLKKKISQTVTFRAAAMFGKGHPLEFDVVIKNDTLITVGEPPASGHFRLVKKKE